MFGLECSVNSLLVFPAHSGIALLVLIELLVIPVILFSYFLNKEDFVAIGTLGCLVFVFWTFVFI
jgi:hypothetical protein